MNHITTNFDLNQTSCWTSDKLNQFLDMLDLIVVIFCSSIMGNVVFHQVFN